jgi:predicted RNA-binding protein with PIN domain
VAIAHLMKLWMKVVEMRLRVDLMKLQKHRKLRKLRKLRKKPPHPFKESLMNKIKKWNQAYLNTLNLKRKK